MKVLGGRTPEHASAQLANELRAVAALDHPNIVRLLHHGAVDDAACAMEPRLQPGSPWIATGLASGGTLDAWLGQWPFPRVRQVLLSLLDALAHAHARGLLHLDVKPANVLLDADERVLLADFGLATAVGATRRRISGTPHFMAPEQFQPGSKDLGPWTDLYAVGCVAVALVDGAPPFGGSSVEEIRAAHFREEVDLCPRVPVPAAFGSWVRRCLAKDPRERFRRAADAALALMALEEGGQVG